MITSNDLFVSFDENGVVEYVGPIGVFLDLLTQSGGQGPMGIRGLTGQTGDPSEPAPAFSAVGLKNALVLDELAWSKVEFKTVEYDLQSANYDDVNSEHLAPIADNSGLWLYTVGVAIATEDHIEIRVTNDAFNDVARVASLSGSVAITVLVRQPLNGTDAFVVEARSLAQGSVLDSVPQTYFRGMRVGFLDGGSPPQTGQDTDQITAGVDDAHENNTQTIFSFTGVNMRAEADTVPGNRYGAGMRFTLDTVPQGATITSAFVEVVFPSGTRDNPDGVWYGNDVDNANNYSSEQDIWTRALTTASVSWVAGSLGAGVYVQSPDLSSIIQEIVNRPGWSPGQSVALMFLGNDVAPTEQGCRFVPFENDPNETVKITVNWSVP